MVWIIDHTHYQAEINNRNYQEQKNREIAVTVCMQFKGKKFQMRALSLDAASHAGDTQC